jgi:imidazolonepropionase-like amidohydrolase
VTGPPVERKLLSTKNPTKDSVESVMTSFRSRLKPVSLFAAVGVALAATGAFSLPAFAQDLGIKAAPQKDAITIINATLHPVSSPVIEKGYIIMARGSIVAVGSGPPAMKVNGTTIDAAGKHIYPGLIAANTQLGLAEMAAVRASNDINEVGDITPESRAAVAVNPDSTLLPVTRSNGILVAAVFPEGGRIPGRVSVMKLDGWTWEEMTVKGDAGLAIEWPQARAINAPWMERSETEQAEDIRRGFAVIDDVFKSAEAYRLARKADTNTPIDLRLDAMRGVLPLLDDGASTDPKAPKARQLPVFITAQDLDQITTAVTWTRERKLKMVLVGGRDASLCTDLLKRHSIPVIINGTHATPKRADSPYDDAYTLPARLHAVGVKFCIASADRTAHERNLPYNAATAAAYGLPRDEALRSVTLSAAEILGVYAGPGGVGSLEANKAATLIITDGDPLEITTKIERAFIDGREIDLSNKQTRLAEKYREKYKQQKAAQQKN